MGSKALAERHHLGVSPATIRNDMALLEEEGYIAQPHTSAGRVPTDKGYRLFVDRLAALKPLSTAERKAIASFLEGAIDLDDVLHRTVRLLAQLTRQVAVVQYPSLARSAVRHLEVVHLAATRLMLVLITDTGRVEQRVVELPVPVERRASSPTCARRSTRRCADRRLADAPEIVDRAAGRDRAGAAAAADHDDHRAAGDAGRAAGGAGRARRHRQPHPQRAGLPGHDPAGAGGAGGAGRAAAADRRGAGPEPGAGPHRRGEPVRGAAVDLGRHGRIRLGRARPSAASGVLGPTRMDYAGTMSAVAAVARYIGQILGTGG